ncbi:NADP-dependent isocitrate dehydrogenase [Marivirga sp. S37H4]|uniref:Isocitrate dehydrogenase [NADP] n=1 Tax=Marivirga aurantiaca TaxID=2802615 RepID=A0A934X0J4_9BACT|nr:NADP-dependent isocitrate dehydrogenase [Marivirga aurantiaca]MBK6266271.1 NADP-dependent isocitrate dehydrogenase [Marivirga aurantiaca]
MKESASPESVLNKPTKPLQIVIAKGDGIGPEIMDATLKILEAANVKLEPKFIEIGEKAYLEGITTGITQDSLDAIRKYKVMLKAPITTPQGKGYKSLNVTIRKYLGLFANIRPAVSYYPIVKTKHPKMDVVVVRENEEDLYAGIEHQQTDEVVQCLKLISRPGSEKIIRYAFEYARKFNRKKVTCLVKDNIMKLSDGLFHEVFKEVAKEYPEIEAASQIIDIACAHIANRPENYDVIVTTNLYGDIVSDITAEISGSVGLAGSANIGREYAMFEAIHGSAPDIAGMGIANPSGLLHGAIQMLQYLGEPEKAAFIHNAWLRTIEDGVHTGEIYNPELSSRKVNTSEFADAVIERLGQNPQKFDKITFNTEEDSRIFIEDKEYPAKDKKLVGVDIYVDHKDRNAEKFGQMIEKASEGNMPLRVITNRGVKVYPDGLESTFCSDHWRCRYIADEKTDLSNKDIIELLSQLNIHGIDVIKTDNLYNFDGKRAYSLGQGE